MPMLPKFKAQVPFKRYVLLWMALFASSAALAEPINLAQLEEDYVAQSGDTLTDTLSSAYMLSIADGAEVVLKNAVVVREGYEGGAGIICEGSCTIFLEDSNFVKSNQSSPGIHIPEGHTLVIDGPGSLDVRSDDFAAGIGSGYYYSDCGNIEIRGGVITAVGGSSSAGIGGGHVGSVCGNIVISGGEVTAKGGGEAAAIGCSHHGKCGDVTITSGVTKVVAEKGVGAVSGIGLGDIGIHGKVTIDGVEIEKAPDSVFTFVPGNFWAIKFDKNHDDATGTMDNQKAIYRATAILAKNAFVRDGWMFVGWNTSADGKGVSYGDRAEVNCHARNVGDTVTLYAQWKELADLAWATIDDVRPYYFLDGKNPVPVAYSVTSLDGKNLKEGTDYKVVVTKGQNEFGANAITSAGDYVFTVKGVGDYKGSQSFKFTVSEGKVVDLSSLTGDYVARKGDILMGKLADSYKVSVEADATIKIKDAVIDSVDEERYEYQGVYKCGWDKPSWSGLTCEGNCTIILDGDNIAKGHCWTSAGIYVPQGRTLTIDGKGSLETSAGGWGAGIGGVGQSSKSGNVVILDGTIKATGKHSSAGIGGSNDGQNGSITIKGGFVTAIGNGGAAGIGGGYSSGSGENSAITITGGTVIAEGGENAPAIGGGLYSVNNVIKIGGGNITAKGGYASAGIGCSKVSDYNGFGTMCATVEISGGSVVAEAGTNAGAAIGGGRGAVLISGGDVTATGTYEVPGICSEDSVVISGGAVTAVGGRDAPGIGGVGFVASEYKTFGDIIITGGTVKSTGGRYSSGLGAGIYSHGGNIIITPDVVMVYVDVDAEHADDSPYSVGTASYGSTLGKLIIDGEEWDYRTEKPFIYYGRGYKDTTIIDVGPVDIARSKTIGGNPRMVNLKKTYNALGRIINDGRKVRGAYYRKKFLAP